MTTELMQPKLKGKINAIPSKSHVHRLLIAAALYGKSTRIICSGKLSDDIFATIKCLQALGADITVNDGEILISGINVRNATAQMFCGESGSTLRFMLPVVCALGTNADFYPEGRLPQRPLSPLREELISHGCLVDEVGTVPFKTSGKLKGGKFEIAGNISSQYITGLLFALPLLSEKSEICIIGKLESRPYVDMTLEVLSQFGVDIKVESDSLITINGSSYNKVPDETLTFYADGDWSNAAFWLVAGAVGSAEICVSGLRMNSTQGDKVIVDVLKAFGANVSIEEARDCIDSHSGSLYDITVFPSELRGIEINAADIPDLVPILALAAACAAGSTKIYNAQRLRLKESDRIATVCDLLRSLGADILPTEDGLLINACSSGNAMSFRMKGGNVSSHNDHRIAMTAAVAATVCQGAVVIDGAEAVNKSYPLFWHDYDTLNINKE